MDLPDGMRIFVFGGESQRGVEVRIAAHHVVLGNAMARRQKEWMQLSEKFTRVTRDSSSMKEVLGLTFVAFSARVQGHN
jgi:hypothetical protein